MGYPANQHSPDPPPPTRPDDRREPSKSTVYRLRIDGHLDTHWSTRLPGLAIEHQPDGTSTLIGPIADQAQLHGVLAGLRDIGAVIAELRRRG
jgi:hypothetical protein